MTDYDALRNDVARSAQLSNPARAEHIVAATQAFALVDIAETLAWFRFTSSSVDMEALRREPAANAETPLDLGDWVSPRANDADDVELGQIEALGESEGEAWAWVNWGDSQTRIWVDLLVRRPAPAFEPSVAETPDELDEDFDISAQPAAIDALSALKSGKKKK